MGLFDNKETYNKDIVRYKTKYTQFRRELNNNIIKRSLLDYGYSLDSLKSILDSDDINFLVTLVKKIAKSLPSGVGNLSSIMFCSIVSELLDIADIEFDLHIGFMIPVKLDDKNKYNYAIVNYMYIVTNGGKEYHYFNGCTDSSNFTFIHDDIVEV